MHSDPFLAEKIKKIQMRKCTHCTCPRKIEDIYSWAEGQEHYEHVQKPRWKDGKLEYNPPQKIAKFLGRVFYALKFGPIIEDRVANANVKKSTIRTPYFSQKRGMNIGTLGMFWACPEGPLTI